MADDNGNASPPNRTHRSSFAGETFANLFSNGHRGSISRNSNESNGSNMNGSQQPTHSYQGPITTAAAQAQRRRLSLTTLGLSGPPNTSSPFGSYGARRDSYASRDSIDESAIEDDAAPAEPIPQTPFARRVSFGAKALKDVKAGGGGGGGKGNTSPGQNGGHTSAPSPSAAQKASTGTISSRDAKGRGSSEGFNWSENFRTRAERASSIAGGTGMSAGSGRIGHGRAQSVAVMEPPAREMPKSKEQVRPDHFQERILKGDFYMD